VSDQSSHRSADRLVPSNLDLGISEASGQSIGPEQEPIPGDHLIAAVQERRGLDTDGSRHGVGNLDRRAVSVAAL
jgi:hypothetical protein